MIIKNLLRWKHRLGIILIRYNILYIMWFLVSIDKNNSFFFFFELAVLVSLFSKWAVYLKGKKSLQKHYLDFLVHFFPFLKMALKHSF